MEKEKNFEISGDFLEKNCKKIFVKKISAVNQNFAAEKILSILGSKHGIRRRNIFLKEIKEVKEVSK